MERISNYNIMKYRIQEYKKLTLEMLQEALDEWKRITTTEHRAYYIWAKDENGDIYRFDLATEEGALHFLKLYEKCHLKI